MTAEDPAACGIVACGFIDCIAVLHAGWDAEAPSHLRRSAGLEDWKRPLDFPAGPSGEAALHLAAAAHALDFDDTAFGGHISAVLVPAILAEAAVRPVIGRDAVAAYLAGYELWAELAEREPTSVHGKGWHPSAIYGAPAAAATVARLRGLDRKRTATAISLATSMAGGVVAQFGTWAKPWQLGRAARSGHEAAALAAAEMRAAEDVLEHPLGFLAALSPSGTPRTGGEVEANLRIRATGLNFKRYPVCYAMHRVLDAVSALRDRHAIDLRRVAGVTAEIGRAQAAMLRYASPEDVTEAAFSLQFGISAMLVRGRCGPAELATEVVRDPAIRALLPKIEIETLDGRLDDEPSLSPWDRVTITLDDGSTLVSDQVVYPLGHFRNPMPGAALRAKFDACLAGRLDGAASERLHALLARLPEVEDIASLGRTGELIA